MSYCRRGYKNSQIYLYGDVSRNAIVCFMCSLNDFEDVCLAKRTEAIAHMKKHQMACHIAPFKKVIDRLEKEIKEEGDIVDYSNIMGD